MKKKKLEPELRFAIAINSDLEELDMEAATRNLFPNFVSRTPVALRESKNLLVLDKSDLFDPQKTDEENGYLYYKYELSVFPMDETTLEYQRNLAEFLLKQFKRIGFQAELICEDGFFENQLSTEP